MKVEEGLGGKRKGICGARGDQEKIMRSEYDKSIFYVCMKIPQ